MNLTFNKAKKSKFSIETKNEKHKFNDWMFVTYLISIIVVVFSILAGLVVFSIPPTLGTGFLFSVPILLFGWFLLSSKYFKLKEVYTSELIKYYDSLAYIGVSVIDEEKQLVYYPTQDDRIIVRTFEDIADEIKFKILNGQISPSDYPWGELRQAFNKEILTVFYRFRKEEKFPSDYALKKSYSPKEPQIFDSTMSFREFYEFSTYYKYIEGQSAKIKEKTATDVETFYNIKNKFLQQKNIPKKTVSYFH